MTGSIGLKCRFLLIGREAETEWSRSLREALSPLGKLHTVQEEESVNTVIREHYDLIIIDTRAVHDAALLTFRLRAERPEARVVVAAASPDWKAAREVLQAGAADYVRRSLDKVYLCYTMAAVLELPSPPYSD